MDFKNVIAGDKKRDNIDYYWSIVIEPGWVQSCLWKLNESDAQIVSTSAPCAWDLDDELVDTTNSALSSVVQNLEEDIEEPSKTIFGVPTSWVKDGEIEAQRLETIKNLCKKLSLKPVGFVVLQEAIAHYKKSEEESPLTAVVIGLGGEKIDLGLFRLGNLIGSTTVTRSISISDDVVEGLSRFKGSDLPSRFVLFNGKEGELDDVKQQLLKINWQENEELKLLHTPKIEVLRPEEKVYATTLAGAYEIGSVKDIIIDTPPALEKVDRPRDVPLMKSVGLDVENKSEVKPEDLGFVVGDDLPQNLSRSAPSAVIEEVPLDQTEVNNVINQVPTLSKKSAMPKFSISTFLKGFIRLVKNLPGFIKLPNVSRIKRLLLMPKQAIVFAVASLLTIVILLFVAWWVYPSAEIDLYVSAQKLEQEVDIIVDANTKQVDMNNKIIPGTKVNTKLSGEKSRSTTGTKIIGDKAKGEVTIYRVGTSVKLPAGTSIIGPNDLNFTLDETIEIASGSAGTPGVSQALVTALQVGAQYNLASNTSFGVGDFSASDIEAKNSVSFSGGSSQEVSAVSDDDYKKLEGELREELIEKATEMLRADISSNQIFITESVSESISGKNFNGKVGDEAATLKLDMEMNVIALVVDKLSITDLVKEVLNERIPEGFVLRDDQLDLSFDFGDSSEERYDVTVYIIANLLPKVDTDKIAMDIKGKYPRLVDSYLNSQVPGFVRAEIVLNPKLPGRHGTLPHIPDKINVTLSRDK